MDPEQEKRVYFRINVRVAVEFIPVPESCINDKTSAFPLPVQSNFSLLNQLHTIDAGHSSLLHLISEKDRTLASYLKSISEKIDLLATTLTQADQKLADIPQQTVMLSEGGLCVTSTEPLEPGTYLAIKIMLLPSAIGLLLYGQVVNCNSYSNESHRLNICFEQLSEANRQIIARHVLQHQARARRETIDQNMAENDD